ncbi:unnamed protein product [Porites evermanni]|uniref:LicD/FKTN/FKRP nucleotidyltransferase domain-containing protein n=1 Tax=Porites evermanni TaxID=104178 RepID=A0ABN8LDM7_9CNID|nr:unnamed protein product [Porites evermanni]
MDSANGKLDPSVYGELGCPKNPNRKDFYEILRHWIQISKQNNIEYVLACGSLLGAMRDGDVIPYDSDVDVLVEHGYFSILERLSVKRDFNPSDGKIRLVVQPEFALNISMDDRRRFNCEGKETIEMEDKCSFQEPMARLIKGNLFLDVFAFYNRVDVVEDPSENRLKKYHKNDFYPFRPCSFMGLQASCPNNSWEVLRLYFGSDNLEPIHKCKNGSWDDTKK